MATKPPVLDPERLGELRQALARLDPAGRKTWLLEVYDLRNGEEVLESVIDLKTGRPWRARGKDRAAEGNQP